MNESSLVRYVEDEIIIRQGEYAPCLYKIMSGNVAMYVNYNEEDEYLIGILSAPRCFGEMSLLARQCSPYTMVCINETVLLRVAEDSFHHFIGENYQNSLMIMKTMARNMSLLNMNMSLLIDELNELCKTDNIDEESLKRLTSKYGKGELLTTENLDEEYTEDMGNGDIKLLLPKLKKYANETREGYKNYTYKKEYTCTHCGRVFEGRRIFYSKLVKDRSKSKDMRCDMRSFYDKFEPYWYDLVTCPHCYFTAYSACFLEGKTCVKKNYQQQLAEAIKEVHLDFKAEKDINFVYVQHYLALICAQGYYNRKHIIAKLWKNLCWFYEDVKDEEMEQYAAGVTAAYLSDLVDCEKGVDKGNQGIILITAAMYEKAGNHKEAKRYAKMLQNTNVSKLYAGKAFSLLER